MFCFMPRYMVTLSASAEGSDKANASCDMIIWDVRKGTACRNFSGTIDSWPAFKWSFDDAYVATLQAGKIYIYEVASGFKLLDKKPIAMPVGINDFAWSPTDNIISFWTPETNNTPARLVDLFILSSANRIRTGQHSTVDSLLSRDVAVRAVPGSRASWVRFLAGAQPRHF